MHEKLESDYNPFRLPVKSKLLAATAERLLGLSPLAKHYEAGGDSMEATDAMEEARHDPRS